MPCITALESKLKRDCIKEYGRVKVQNAHIIVILVPSQKSQVLIRSRNF